MSFVGFSEDDIKRLKDNTTILETSTTTTPKQSIKKTTLKVHTKTTPPRKPPSKLSSDSTSTNHPDITESAKLNRQSSHENEHQIKSNENTNAKKPNHPGHDHDIKPDQSNGDIAILTKSCANKESNAHGSENSIDSEREPSQSDSGFELRSIDLSEFEAKQKVLEEQNKKRKELLSKALADRTKQTQEESQRLHEIQNEFKKLDALLSNDVKILRKQIDFASAEYYEVEKKYRRVEKEFLEAKILLHQKLERKQMLTEHLCAIIERNEERKAEKLDELLQKLQLNPQL